MNAREYLLNQLSDLAVKFPAYTYKYWYSELDEYHYIEVVPSEFKESEAFINLEIKILTEFYKLFINESLTFSTEGNLQILDQFELIQIFKLPWMRSFTSNQSVKAIKVSRIEDFKDVSELSYNYAYAA